VRALLTRHKLTFVWTGVLFGIAQASLFAGPLLLREIIAGLECEKFAEKFGVSAAAAGCTAKRKMYEYASRRSVDFAKLLHSAHGIRASKDWHIGS